MGKVIVGTGSNDGVDTNIAPGVSRYFSICYGYCPNITTESQAKSNWGADGIFFNACMKITSNTLTSATTHYKTRINGADGAFDIVIGPGLTGTFTDLSTYEVVSQGDEVDFLMQADASGTGGIHFIMATLDFVADTGHVVQMGSSLIPVSVFSNGFQRRVPLFGAAQYSTSTTLSEAHTDVDGTLSRLQVIVAVNARTTTTTGVSRVNGANGNMSVPIGPGLTGIFIDLSNSDTLVAGDTFGSAINFGASAEAFAMTSTQAVFTNNLSRKVNLYNGRSAFGSVRAASATTNYTTFLFNIDNLPAITNEDNVKYQMNFDNTLSLFSVKVGVNTYTSDATMRVRINETDGNGVIVVGAGLTGLFQDLVNSDVISQGDEVDYSIVGGTSGSINVRYFSTLMETPQGEYAGGYIF